MCHFLSSLIRLSKISVPIDQSPSTNNLTIEKISFDKLKICAIIKIEIRSHKSGRPLNGILNTHSNQQAECVFAFYLLNICTSTIIKAIVMIVTDTNPVKSKIINCINISIIHITSFVEATHFCFSLFLLKIIQTI